MSTKYAGELALNAIKDWAEDKFVPIDGLVSKTITANGTYDPADDSADGYSSVTVNIPTATGVSF